jgi:hypothetical protein
MKESIRGGVSGGDRPEGASFSSKIREISSTSQTPLTFPKHTDFTIEQTTADDRLSGGVL